jgi:hypothetical protein
MILRKVVKTKLGKKLNGSHSMNNIYSPTNLSLFEKKSLPPPLDELEAMDKVKYLNFRIKELEQVLQAKEKEKSKVEKMLRRAMSAI